MFDDQKITAIKKKLKKEKTVFPVVFTALGDKSRFRIFRILIEEAEVCVTDVAKILGMTVSAASQQLKILELSGIVQKERMGQMMCYSLRKDEPVVKEIIALM